MGGICPTTELKTIESGTVSEINTYLLELSASGEPQTVDELKSRINKYIEFCAHNDIRVGIESLCLALGTNRQKLWRWCRGAEKGSNREWQTACIIAKQYVASYLESLMLSGHLNPASSIFLLKNWCGYADKIEIDTETAPAKSISVHDLPTLSELTADEHETEPKNAGTGIDIDLSPFADDTTFL